MQRDTAGGAEPVWVRVLPLTYCWFQPPSQALCDTIYACAGDQAGKQGDNNRKTTGTGKKIRQDIARSSIFGSRPMALAKGIRPPETSRLDLSEYMGLCSCVTGREWGGLQRLHHAVNPKDVIGAEAYRQAVEELNERRRAGPATSGLTFRGSRQLPVRPPPPGPDVLASVLC